MPLGFPWGCSPRQGNSRLGFVGAALARVPARPGPARPRLTSRLSWRPVLCGERRSAHGERRSPSSGCFFGTGRVSLCCGVCVLRASGVECWWSVKKWWSEVKSDWTPMSRWRPEETLYKGGAGCRCSSLQRSSSLSLVCNPPTISLQRHPPAAARPLAGPCRVGSSRAQGGSGRIVKGQDGLWFERWAFDSAKNHKRKRRKRQSVTAKKEKSQTPKFV